ncbi:MAG: hypothetical protein IT280_07325 [Ignavibacteria bacterium]|nr:hypothetical protein [Ignavibacteria bacterium]
MRYVILAILIYIIYLFIRRFLISLNNRSEQTENNNKSQTQTPKKKYDLNMIQDAEFREVKKEPDKK